MIAVRYLAGPLLLAILFTGCGGEDGLADDDLADSIILPVDNFPEAAGGWDTEDGADEGVLAICAFGTPPGLTGHAGPQGYVRDRDRLTKEVAVFDSPSAAQSAVGGLDARVECLAEGFQSGDFDNDAGTYANVQIESITFDGAADMTDARQLTVEFTTRTSQVTVPVTFDIVYLSTDRAVLVLMSASTESALDPTEFEAIAEAATSRASALLDAGDAGG